MISFSASCNNVQYLFVSVFRIFGSYLAEIFQRFDKNFVLKTCENRPETGYQFLCKLDKANNAYCYFYTLGNAFFL